MGGHIWIESEGLGKGSTFSFVVKLGVCNKPNEAAMPAAVDRANQRRGELFNNIVNGRNDDNVSISIHRYEMNLL